MHVPTLGSTCTCTWRAISGESAKECSAESGTDPSPENLPGTYAPTHGSIGTQTINTAAAAAACTTPTHSQWMLLYVLMFGTTTDREHRGLHVTAMVAPLNQPLLCHGIRCLSGLTTSTSS